MTPHNDRNVRVVIPARYSSTRLPGKPLADINGRPMIVRVHDAISAARPDSDIVVAVDDDRVAGVVAEYGISYEMTSVECESGSDRVAEVARSRGWAANDLVINVQGDEPLLPADLFNEFILFCTAPETFAMGSVMVPIVEPHDLCDQNVVKVVTDATGGAMYFSRSSIPFDRDSTGKSLIADAHHRHVGIYAYRNDVLQRITATPTCDLERIEKLEQLRALWLGIRIDMLRWPQTPPGGVDTPADLERVRRHLRSVGGMHG